MMAICCNEVEIDVYCANAKFVYKRKLLQIMEI